MVFARNDLDGPRQGAFLPLVLLWLLGSVSLGLLGPYGTWVTLELQWRVLFWAGILIAALTVVGGRPCSRALPCRVAPIWGWSCKAG